MSERRPGDVHFLLTRTRYEESKQVQTLFGHHQYDSVDGWNGVSDLVVVAVVADDD